MMPSSKVHIIRALGRSVLFPLQLAPASGCKDSRDRPDVASTTVAESTVNYIVSKRFVKQQMRWTPRGAPLLLQTRVQVLNDDLRNAFCRWFPGMMPDGQVALKAAA
jgi:hypothetical protein